MTSRRDCICERYCKCAWCCYLFCLFTPVLSLLLLLGWGIVLLLD